MEIFPKFEERGNSEQEIIGSLKESFVELSKKMRRQIEAGEYNAIISDDSGGRIPTLLLREIFKLVNPEHDFLTLFTASGQFYFPKNESEKEKLIEYLKKGLKNAEKVLLVTQYIHTGKTLYRLVDFLKESGVKKVDVSTIDINTGELTEESAISKIGCDNIFVGGLHNRTQFGLSENHNILSGVSKSKEYSPVPKRLDRVIESGERKRSEFMIFSEQDELMGIDEMSTPSEIREARKHSDEVFAELDSVPLSEDEKVAIQKNINKTRSHIKELAKEIVFEVWEK